MAIRDVLKKAAVFAAGCAGAVALLLSVFLFGKRTGKKESAVNVKADEAARKKESEIEKSSAADIVAQSDNVSELVGRKEALKNKFNSNADSITDEFLHRRGHKGSGGGIEG